MLTITAMCAASACRRYHWRAWSTWSPILSEHRADHYGCVCGRCVSQMVLARVANIKSGWKSMFMVFTTAASDESPVIVRLAFETIEKIVREHFDYITETEVRLEQMQA